MKVMLLCTSFNGLSQRVWLDLRAAGIEVAVHAAGDAESMPAAVAAFDPALVICPFLRERVPVEVWHRWRTVVIHPGPLGDRGPSSLDWAMTEGARSWGVTALQAVEALDAGPIWGSRTFRFPLSPLSKSGLYGGPVTEAAVDLVREVVAKASDPTFVPWALDVSDPGLPGRPRPRMRQSDRTFCWSDTTEQIVRRVRAADGSPGVRTSLRAEPVTVFDAHPGPDVPNGRPGTVAAHRHGGLLVRTGDGAVWIGQLRRAATGSGPAVKLPAASALPGGLAGVPRWRGSSVDATGRSGFREIGYERHGLVGVLSFDFYNGAFSSADCRRLAAAVRRAAARDTRVLVLRGGHGTYANGIHLNVIEAAPDPVAEAWCNINAIDDLCREIITTTNQIVVSAVTGSAGAGGVMLALAAHRVLLRDGVVLNPHYRTMGLYGSEYWTYTLPRRVGQECAAELTERCLPLDAREAVRTGLADEVLPGLPVDADRAVLAFAVGLAESDDYPRLLAAEQDRRAADERRRPLDTYRIHELAEMRRDIFDDRHGFAEARRAFIMKRPLPGRSRAEWEVPMSSGIAASSSAGRGDWGGG